MERISNQSILRVLLLCTSLLIPMLLNAAADQSTLITFSPNTTISSSQVNQNFVMLDNDVSSLDERLGVFEDAITIDPVTYNVGIGTPTPNDVSKLTVQGTRDQVRLSDG